MAIGRREALALGGVALAALAAGLVLAPGRNAEEDPADILRRTQFVDLKGRPRQLREWLGRAVVCNFWATWCAPCRDEMPMLDGTHRRFSEKGAEVVGIGIDQASKIAEFAKSLRISYSLWVGDGATLELMRRLGNASVGLPFTVVLDREGAIRERRLGIYHEAELSRLLGELVGA